MSILRIYDPPECDEQGVPLDWECCRKCNGVKTIPSVAWPGGQPCATCNARGSLKAAALAQLSMPGDAAMPWSSRTVIRCESCSHPMSEGTWEPDPAFTSTADRESFLARIAAAGFEYNTFVHYSPCDEGCRHGGPGRLYADLLGGSQGWTSVTDQPPAEALALDQVHRCEASWRQVDIRRMGWPHDLRPEKLAVLCTRCYAERTKTT